MSQKKFVKLAAAGLLALYSVAHAQTAGTIIVRGGYNHFFPQVRSGDMNGVPGAKIEVGDGGNLFGAIDYMVTDHYSVEFLMGNPPRHNIYGDGSLSGTGKIADTKIVPPGLFLQYRFNQANAQIRPYLGAGLVYAKFIDNRSTSVLNAMTGSETSINIDSAWGGGLQCGFSYAISKHWSLDLAVEQLFVRTTAHLSTGQSINATLNPVATNVTLGYAF